MDAHALQKATNGLLARGQQDAIIATWERQEDGCWGCPAEGQGDEGEGAWDTGLLIEGFAKRVGILCPKICKCLQLRAARASLSVNDTLKLLPYNHGTEILAQESIFDEILAATFG